MSTLVIVDESWVYDCVRLGFFMPISPKLFVRLEDCPPDQDLDVVYFCDHFD